MSEKITVPTLGESVTEATVSKWLKSQGEKVIADEPIVELETDKVNVEVPAPINGILGTIAVKEGETVNVGSLLGTINNNSNQDLTKSNEIKDYSPPKKSIKKEIRSSEKKNKPLEKKIDKSKISESVLKLEEESIVEDVEPLILDKVHKEKQPQRKVKTKNIETKISPAARKMASEANVDINKIKGLEKME